MKLAGEGKGRPTGHAKGGADVVLREGADGTILAYDVNAQVGGKLAQLGSRLIDSTAKKLSAQFFTKFAKIVEKQTEPAADSQEFGKDTSKSSMWNRLKKSVGA